jgi:ribulose 1,5-bisphosphate synthetase/thiazole synthase
MIRCGRIIAGFVVFPVLLSAQPIEVDVCVYGGTSGGIAAAIQGARMNRRVVLLEFDGHIGGLTTGGLGATDIGNKAAIGGIAREFYSRIAAHYSREEAWVLERSAE